MSNYNVSVGITKQTRKFDKLTTLVTKHPTHLPNVTRHRNPDSQELVLFALVT